MWKWRGWGVLSLEVNDSLEQEILSHGDLESTIRVESTLDDD